MIIVITGDIFFKGTCVTTFGASNTIFVRSYEEMKGKVQEKPDDVVIVDLQTAHPFDITKLKSNVLVLTGVPKFKEAMELMRYGIRGYGNIAMMAENLKQAVDAIKSGQVWMPPYIISKMITAIPTSPPEPEEDQADISELTDRELEVSKLVASGMTNKEIAEEIEVTVRTVKAHMTSIFNKTGLRDRVALALRFKPYV
jgi:DNA-binding NarL/FixJ family response regulator